MFNFVPDPDNYVIVLRFMGTSPTTSNICNTLKSVIQQLAKVFNMPLPDKNLETKVAIRDFLFQQLVFISTNYPNTKLILFLDSIDQLSTEDYNTEWIIYELPKNVKMIYSTLPNHGGILDRIKCMPLMTDTFFMNITSLSKTIVKTILENWLSKHHRSLSEKQWKVLDALFERAKLFPLYIKLMFDIIVKWPSFFEPPDRVKDLVNINHCIKYLFNLLENDHGKLLFTRSIIYMTSFKNGISESELEDILSIDDDVLFEIFEYHAPPVRRFPAALWARIKHDLSEYMVEKEANGTRVIYWLAFFFVNFQCFYMTFGNYII